MHPVPQLQLRSVPFPPELLRDSKDGQRYRSELWLYLVLRALASPRLGQVLVSRDDLADLLGRKPDTIASQLGRLRATGYIDVRRGRGQLLVRVRHWSPVLEDRREHHEDLDEMTAGTGALARRIALGLGDEANLARYEELCEEFPTELIERAFRDAAAMPSERIRKSRGALFTYLLRKYAQHQESE